MHRHQGSSTHARIEPLEPRLLLSGSVVISEFMASNGLTLLDGDGNSSDWLEIHNPTDSAISLDGWYLTDKTALDSRTKWRFPDVNTPASDVTIGPGGYLVVFASGRDDAEWPYYDAGGYLHTNFKLDRNDDTPDDSVLLVRPDGATIEHGYEDYPKQVADVSYGLPDTTTTMWETLVWPGAAGSYHVPTPGEDVLAWTTQEYPDATWVDTIVSEAADLVITEIEAGDTDWIEIQNVCEAQIDTTGWFVAVNDASGGNINDVHGRIWNLPASIPAGQVLYRTDDPGDNFFGSEISWDADVGWAVIVDAGGDVVDFLPWGYARSEIDSLAISAGGFDNITIGSQWNGAAPTIALDSWRTYNAGQDIGGPSKAGSYTCNDTAGTFTVSGGGRDIWNDSDQFYFVHQPFSGDGQIIARVNSIDNTNSWAKAGVMIRETLAADSANVMTDVTAANGVSFQRRRATGRGGIHTTISGLSAPYWVKLVRQGDTFTGYTSADGNSWTRIASTTVPMARDVHVGLAVTAHDDGGPLCTAVFDHVSVASGDPATTIARQGGSDGNRASDFVATPIQSKGVQNPGLPVPFVVTSVPVATALGFSDDLGNYDGLIETDLAAAMRGVNASVWSRLDFDVDDPSHFAKLTLRMKYDDGFVAYLNGVEVARRNALDPLTPNSSATQPHPAPQAVVFEDIDVTDYLTVLEPGVNVLAIHGLNAGAADEDFLLLPELIAQRDPSQPQYMATPTPGGANIAGTLGIVADTRFSVDRGFFTEPFVVEITTATAGADIYYTLDGSEANPAGPTSVLYDPNVSIAIGATSILRAAAFKPGYQPSNVDTHTYVFTADVIKQSTMSTAITRNAVWAPMLADALVEIPTVSLVTPFSISQVERETSIELIFPDGQAGFQVDAGVEHYGGHSLGYPKKSMRISFKEIYGPGRLKFDLFGEGTFGEGTADEFDQIILRTGSHDTMFWTHPGTGARGTFIRNRWISDRQLEMGQPAPRGRFVHVYINGRYWGQHQLMERPNAAFMASYFGGDKDDYDALNSGNPIDGDKAAWNAMVASKGDYQVLQQYMDVVNYADYMLLNFYAGNDWDWRHWQNWMAARKREPGAGYKFIAWDNDVILRTGPDANVIANGGPGNLWGAIGAHGEFRMLLADRAQKYFFNDGMLTPGRVLADIDDLAALIRNTIVPETARWGISKGYTPDTWQQAVDWIKTTFVPGRTDVVVEQMRTAGLLPNVDAPAFNRHGGPVSDGFGLTMTADAYYTRDGSDPRLPGGAISPSALRYDGTPLVLAQSGLIRARVRQGSQWSAVNEAMFFVGAQAGSENLAITELNYHPQDPTAAELLVDPMFQSWDFEFIEFRNVGDQTIDLTGVRLGDAIGFDFLDSNVRALAPGRYAVIVADRQAFEARYGTGIDIAGQFTGRLRNEGEALKLTDYLRQTLANFAYDDSGAWPGRADGKGATLEIIDPAGSYDGPDNWRSSVAYGGTPGAASEAPVGVVVNEVLTHTDAPDSDTIELHNTTGADINIGGWYLSDSWGWDATGVRGNYKKFRIPDGTVIGAGQYLTFNESHFNPTLGADPRDFALSGAHGDDVWFMKADGAGRLTHFADHVDLPAAPNGQSLGRWPNATGDMYPMAHTTLAADNTPAGPARGQVVITEIMYHPPDASATGGIDPGDLEFIELYNATAETVHLARWLDNPHVAGQQYFADWRLRGGVDMEFDLGVTIDPGRTLVVLSFNPDSPANADRVAVFKAWYGIAPGASPAMVGGFGGWLDNSGGDPLRLQRPDSPPLDEPDFVPHTLEDEVRYDELSPWPAGAGGTGLSIHRLDSVLWGNDPASWTADAPTPGSVDFADTTAPTVTALGLAATGSTLGTVDSAMWTTGRSARTAPWSVLDKLVVTFGEPVTAAVGDLALVGIDSGELTATAINGSGTNTVTWTVAAGEFLASDRYTVALIPTVTDMSGNPLADFRTADLNVLVGDITGDGRVSSRDRRDLRDSYGSTAGGANYTPLADLNADGRISSRDRRVLRDNYGTALPDSPSAPVPTATNALGDSDSDASLAAASRQPFPHHEGPLTQMSDAPTVEAAHEPQSAPGLAPATSPFVMAIVPDASPSQARPTGATRTTCNDDNATPAAAELEPELGVDLTSVRAGL